MKSETDNKLIRRYRVFPFEPNGNVSYYNEAQEITLDSNEDPLAYWIRNNWELVFPERRSLYQFYENVVEIYNPDIDQVWYFKAEEITLKQ